ncbi:MAG: hypothetical protein EOR68_26355 [Mesorhizobium sp.]|uniref:hypothetical protein n=1 Tax=Mesorhizobium sp. TaxID=1871066 RepID=UPI000FE94971|nr:hypothetical protein [Mesorhizobium sp.]RWL92445.1 MAG: hypothetical protein EOR68_26355 [Mesorhizobium sp.]
MTDPAARAEKLSRELDSAFRNRADLYRLFLDELTAELGAEKAEAAMIRSIEKRGREVAAAAFAGAFDRGLFEVTGVRFDNVTWTPGHGSGCCHIALTNRDA